MVLNKRIIREFTQNIRKYLGLIVLVLISSMAIVGFSDSADSIINTGEKAALQSISLVKIFGFNQREINKLYLGSSFYTVILSAAISIPLALKITKSIYPSLIANVQAYFSIVLEPRDYCFIITLIICAYFMSNILLKRHINSISLSEALKNRD